MTSLLRRIFRPRKCLDHVMFTLYTRSGCGCCRKALDLLRDRQLRYGFKIEEKEIDQDPELLARYDTEVPVVAVDGKVRFRGVVNPALLDRLLAAELRTASEQS